MPPRGDRARSHAARTALGRPVLASGVAAARAVRPVPWPRLRVRWHARAPTRSPSPSTASPPAPPPSRARPSRPTPCAVAADRSATNAQRSVAAARSAQREKVKAAALAKARKAAAEKAAAAAKRKRLIANAQAGPQGRRARADARVRLQPVAVALPRAALDRRERLELQGRELLLRRLRHPPVAARQQDGARWPATSAPTRSPRSSGAWTTSSSPTAPRATRSTCWNSRSPHWY